MKLHSNILGEGPPLVIMHGVFGMSDNWQSLGRKWASQYEVHLLDMRNHGKSPHSDAFSYSVMSDDLLEYLDDRQINKAALLGHSMGGKVAMLFAVLHPERVQKLIVADMAPRGYQPHHHEVLKALHGLDLAKVKSRSDAREQFSEELDEATRQFLLKSLYWKEKGKMAWRFNLPVISLEIKKAGEGLAPNAIFEGAVLFIRGGASDYIKDEDRERIEQHFPQAEIFTVEGAGHWLHAQKPQEFFRAVSDFLSA